MNNTIGGYLPIELKKRDTLHSDGIFVNSGRNALLYLTIINNYTSIHIPYFLCDSVAEVLFRNGIGVKYYHIGEDFLPRFIDLKKNECILIVNYFGIMDGNCDLMQNQYQDSILDCTHAIYYIPKTKNNTFYSPRKFFGLPDGGIIYSNKRFRENLDIDISWERMTHLLKSIDMGIENAYIDFKNNEQLIGNLKLKYMSLLTRKIYDSIDFENIKNIRNSNYDFLSMHLNSSNNFYNFYNFENFNCAMIYPYISKKHKLRERLNQIKIFIPKYWIEVENNSNCSAFERFIASDVIPIPIDQRYTVEQMEYVVDNIRSIENE